MSRPLRAVDESCAALVKRVRLGQEQKALK